MLSSKEDRTTFDSDKLIEVLGQVNTSAFIDKWGPEEVIQVYDPLTSMKGVLVIDNTALGPGKGGIGISPAITPLEVFRLARAMTWKCSLADIPFGGAKAGIRADPNKIDKTKYIKAFAKKVSAMAPSNYITGPDSNVGEKEMAVFAETVGDMQSATGKPERMGGIPHELGTIGYGIVVALEKALSMLNDTHYLPSGISEAKIAIQGLNSVGLGVAKLLSLKGATIVAVSDQWGTIHDVEGIDNRTIERFSHTALKKRPVANSKKNRVLESDAIFSIDCDIFIPSSGSHVLNKDTCSRVKADFIVEGENNAITTEAEYELVKKGAFILPDFLVNAGGVISSYAEHKKMDAAEAFSLIKHKIERNTELVIENALNSGLTPRMVALEIAQQRVLDAMDRRY